MYLMNAVPQYRPETAMVPLNDSISAVQNLIKTPYIAPMAQAQLSQQQTGAQYAPATAQADIAQKLALAQMYGGREQYYQGGAQKNVAQANQIDTGGNTNAANAMRQLIAAQSSGDPTQVQAAYFNLNNVLTNQTAQIQKLQAGAQQSQAQAGKTSAEGVNLGAPGGYISPQLPNQQQQFIPSPINGRPPAGTMAPQSGVPPQGNSPGPMQNLQTQLNNASGQTSSNQTPQYVNQMNDSDIVQSVLNNQMPPLQPMQGSGGGIALKNQSVNAQKQMDSMQTYPSKLQTMYDFYQNNPDYVGPTLSKGGAERGIGNVLNAVGLAPNSYNSYQSGQTNALLAGEGLSQLAVPGTRSGTLISKNIAQISPNQVKNSQAAMGQIQQIAMANIQDLTGYIKGTYLPSVRQSAAAQLQSAMQNPVYRQAYQALQAQQNPQSQPQSSQGGSPAAQGQVFNYNANGTLSPAGQ